MASASSPQSFARDLSAALRGAAQTYTAQENFAHYRFGPEAFQQHPRQSEWASALRTNLGLYASAAQVFEDAESRDIMVECLAFQILGWQRLKRRRNTGSYQALAAALPENADRFPVVEPRLQPLRHKHVHLFAWPERGLRLATADGFFLNVVENQQYFFQRGMVAIRPESGDHVVDCGAGWGDTSVLFADVVGPRGRVYAFEFTPSNLALFHRNLAENPHLSNMVQLVPHAASDRVDDRVWFDDGATSTRLDAGGGRFQVTTQTIDNLVATGVMERVDLIKMDIEGAEGPALRGAIQSIRRFRPKLAICAYHRVDDLIVLPRLIRQICPDYKFYLDHHTIHGEETVIYAAPPERIAK